MGAYGPFITDGSSVVSGSVLKRNGIAPFTSYRRF
jgi:hypothetical protein